MQNRSFGKNIFIVVFSRIISLASGVAVGFILPKIFSVTDYGLYKVFTLYAVYTALLHFGFVDGILLKLSGKEYQELDPRKIIPLTKFFMIFELLIAIVILLVGAFWASGEYLFIIGMLAVNMVLVNVTTYYQFVSQAVQRFKEYSTKNIVISVFKVFFVFVLLALTIGKAERISYRVYLIGLNCLDLLIMAWYIIIYRDITFGKGESIKTVKSDIVSIFKSGILLTLAYQVSHLILTLDRQFVNLLFSTEDFAVYSFAYNIVSMISTMVSSVSIVLLPMLKKRSSEAVSGAYKKCLSTVAMISSGSLLCFFPLVFLIRWFLPEYQGSIAYIAIVLPAFIFTSAITVVMFTITKIFEMNFVFFKDGCLILLLGFGLNVMAYCLFRSPSAISYASLIATMVWFLISGARLKSKTGVGAGKEFAYLFTIASGFLLTAKCISNVPVGFVAYFAWVIICTIIFHKDTVQNVFKALKGKCFHD